MARFIAARFNAVVNRGSTTVQNGVANSRLAQLPSSQVSADAAIFIVAATGPVANAIVAQPRRASLGLGIVLLGLTAYFSGVGVLNVR
jgi:hypothetical protein